MRHHGAARPTMPMRRPAGDMHNIPYLKLPWLLAFGTYQPAAHCYCEDLSPFVGVPESSGAGGEADLGGCQDQAFGV